MINKQKVDEILADMKEEERKKQEVIKAEVDKFLEVRLEYYVAMVINGMVYDEISLLHTLNNDGCNLLFEAKDKINEALEEFDWYLCLKGRHDLDLHYMHISDAKNDIPQPTNVVKRQIELGLRPDTKKAMGLHRDWVEDEIKEIEKQEESIKAMRKEKNGSSPIPIIFLYLVIVILLILFFIFK